MPENICFIYFVLVHGVCNVFGLKINKFMENIIIILSKFMNIVSLGILNTLSADLNQFYTRSKPILSQI